MTKKSEKITEYGNLGQWGGGNMNPLLFFALRKIRRPLEPKIENTLLLPGSEWGVVFTQIFLDLI